MRRPDVPVENVAEIVWGALLLGYLAGAGRPEFLQPAVLAVFGLGGVAALTELYLRRAGWQWLTIYDSVVWTVLLTAMVVVTGGRSSELWSAYILMSLTAPSVRNAFLPYGLLGVNCTLYALAYTLVNPRGEPFSLALLGLRVGMIFLIAWVVDRSMERERQARASAVAVAQNRVQELVSARDAERKRIAGDIHDWLGRGIIAPMRRLELAMRGKTPEETQARIGETIESLRRSHEELRRLMENLHPHLLEQMGLAEALRSYLVQWGAEHEVDVTFESTGGPEPPGDLALAAYRILQEALNNCAKHAQPLTVQVRLERTADLVTLAVLDDGLGFAAPRSGGRGLTGMQERAALFGGTVEVASQPGRGTTVVASLPM